MMDRVQNKPNSCVQHTPSSESFQVHQVLKSELSAIRCACSSVEEGYEPKVTFLVVVKGHHTRFFPRDEDAEGENRNVPVGTVVDREITHPTEVQFYLLSQDVSRPTKYHLLWNDSDDMTQDEIEEITYYLCHVASRASLSTSYPAPTYYAHLAAYRYRSFFDGF
ncbi:protein argonaute-2-like isoform X2 [Cryptotermes secundus]|uniref:protein argonaute-2-like isoform X2 n=1 Tax=Cryptotermes secundus TaxID=105785 RepID=UPI001454D553|nr:protein argonaute-2-like isoform X2 [Cryptotermes secundus]